MSLSFSLVRLLQHQASQLIAKYIAENQIEYDVICGVPYGAFAIATSLSLMTNKPMIFSRKEVKDYGTKKMVEGVYKPEDKCLLIEDVVVYGTSIIETTEVNCHILLRPIIDERRVHS